MARKETGDLIAALEEARRTIVLNGVPAAVKALTEIANDTKAPAPARATAGTSLFRAAGLFEKPGDRLEEKPVHEWTAEELQRALIKIERDLSAGDVAEDDAEAEPNVFE